MPKPILQTRSPDIAPWKDVPKRALPGLSPMAAKDWLLRDEAFARQMALRDRLIADTYDRVVATTPAAQPAAQACLKAVLTALQDDEGYKISDKTVLRPDQTTVLIDRNNPMATIGRLIQADMCLIQPGPKGHVLTAAVLCFPASWTLGEKIGKPMTGIHSPVAEYDATLAKRVQRIFDAMRPDQILSRSNALLYEDPALFAPQRESTPRKITGAAEYIRSERQTLRHLPDTDAIAFGIHTTVMALCDLAASERDAVTASLQS